jgi:hypothetical protein
MGDVIFSTLPFPYLVEASTVNDINNLQFQSSCLNHTHHASRWKNTAVTASVEEVCEVVFSGGAEDVCQNSFIAVFSQPFSKNVRNEGEINVRRQ